MSQQKVWSKYDFIEPNKKLRYGIVPHIDFEFFGPGIVLTNIHQLI